MDAVFSGLASGFATALDPFNLMLVLVGCFAGTLIGALPGIGPINGVAIPGLQPRLQAGIGDHSSRRYLLRRRIWRAHLVDPSQRSRRCRCGDDDPRRQSDGP